MQLYTDKDSLAKALNLFERALKLDPNNVDALVGAALAERNDYIFSGMDENPGRISKIEKLLANAIRIDPTNARADTVRGMLYIITRRTKEAGEAHENAVRLNPSYAPAYAQLAQTQMTPEDLPRALANIDQAMKLSPRDPEMGRWRWIKGRAFNYMGRYQDAIREIQAALDNGYSAWPVHAHLAWAYAFLGRQSEAEAAVGQARSINPRLTIKWLRSRFDFPEVYFEGLRKAGLPEE